MVIDNDSLKALFRRVILACFPLVTAIDAGCGGDGHKYTCENTIHHETPSLSSLSPSEGTDGGTVDGGIDDLIARCQADAADCVPLCQRVLAFRGTLVGCERTTTDAGDPAIHLAYQTYCLGGRPPGGLCPPVVPADLDGVARWLAAAAHMEAASVDAFNILAGELEAHGAPSTLASAARASASDERRHARMIGALAARAGARVPAVRRASSGERSLESVAVENAVEGCVTETFAALLACGQARRAQDPALRLAMRAIAVDETRHAALSWAVDGWAAGHLSPAARRRVRDARRAAADTLMGATSSDELAASVRAPLGLPDATVAVAMARALADHLW